MAWLYSRWVRRQPSTEWLARSSATYRKWKEAPFASGGEEPCQGTLARGFPVLIDSLRIVCSVSDVPSLSKYRVGCFNGLSLSRPGSETAS